jgi:Fe-S-cluster containining protein
MSDEDFICVRCARHMKTCCQRSEIYVTLGDVERICSYVEESEDWDSSRRAFYEFRAPKDPTYSDQDDDPAWREHVFRRDNSRRVLRKQPNGDCTFLGPQGCTLPLDVRPLVCRLYPYEYSEAGIHEELAPGCPLELLRPGQGMIEALQMNLVDARHWHEQLYAEVRREHPDAPSTSCSDAVPVPTASTVTS